MSRVSVTAAQKPKPKETFKFLRRDEGRLSYASSMTESPSKGDSGTPRAAGARDRRDSRSLREAIAYDMRNAKSHDPLGEVVIAVPKKAPPPNSSEEATENSRPAPAAKRAPARAAPKSRPEWVNPELPVRHEPESPAASATRALPSSPSGGAPERHVEVSAAPSGSAEYEPYANRVASPASARRGSDDYSFEQQTPSSQSRQPSRRAGSATRRYADPEFDDYDRNYFRRPLPSTSAKEYSGLPSPGRSRDEDALMAQLEQEVRAAQDERSRYTYAKQQLDREQQRFDSYRFEAQQQLKEERAELDGLREREQRSAQKDMRSLEERCRNVSALLSTERETNRSLMQENDSLRSQLEELTALMRDQQRTQKAEIARMRRDVESLTKRNADLLAIAKDHQIQQLEYPSASVTAGITERLSRAGSPSSHSSPPPALAVSDAYSRADAPSLSPIPPVVEATSSASVADSNGTKSTGERRQSVAMDFTPRSNDGAAQERRAREMADRMQKKDEELQQRRQQREKEAAERADQQQQKQQRVAEEKAAAAAATAAAAAAEVEAKKERQQKAAQEAALAKRRREAEENAKKKREEGERRSREVSNAPEEAAQERKVAGHPLHTPRMQSPGAAAGAKKVAPRSSSASKTAAPETKKFHIPTREELVGSSEEIPLEDDPTDAVASQTPLGDNPNKREVLYRSGKREIHYANGTVKTVLPSGHTTLRFTNGDIKCTFPSGKSTYWYDAAQTTHSQNPDGVQVFEFHATGQTERHLADGTKEILYPDGIYKVVKPDGTDKTYFPDDEEAPDEQS